MDTRSGSSLEKLREACRDAQHHLQVAYEELDDVVAHVDMLDRDHLPFEYLATVLMCAEDHVSVAHTKARIAIENYKGWLCRGEDA